HHQLESRTREIRPFGSEGGAKLPSSLPLSIIEQPAWRSGAVASSRGGVFATPAGKLSFSAHAGVASNAPPASLPQIPVLLPIQVELSFRVWPLPISRFAICLFLRGTTLSATTRSRRERSL